MHAREIKCRYGMHVCIHVMCLRRFNSYVVGPSHYCHIWCDKQTPSQNTFSSLSRAHHKCTHVFVTLHLLCILFMHDFLEWNRTRQLTWVIWCRETPFRLIQGLALVRLFESPLLSPVLLAVVASFSVYDW